MAKNFTKLRKITGTDRVLTQIQSNIDQAFSEIQEGPVLRGVLIKQVAIATSNTFIDHGLGRDFQGFVVARINADARVWESPTNNVQPNTQIILKASAVCTINLWVY